MFFYFAMLNLEFGFNHWTSKPRTSNKRSYFFLKAMFFHIFIILPLILMIFFFFFCFLSDIVLLMCFNFVIYNLEFGFNHWTSKTRTSNKRSYFFLKAMFLTSKLTLVFCWRGTESKQNLLKASISRSSSSISPFSKSMSFGANMLSGN
jgi:hypothetical protein